MDYVSDSISQLTEDDNLLQKVGFGILMLFGSVLVLPYFFYQGYLMRILRETENPTKLPKWDDWKTLFKDGFIAFLLSIGIVIPTSIITYGPRLAGLSSEIIIVSQIVGFIVSLVTNFALFALLTMIMRDGFSELTNFSRLVNIVSSKEYMIAYLLTTAAGIAIGIFTFVFIIFTLGLGLIVLPVIMVPFNYVIISLIGLAITEVEATEYSGNEVVDTDR